MIANKQQRFSILSHQQPPKNLQKPTKNHPSHHPQQPRESQQQLYLNQQHQNHKHQNHQHQQQQQQTQHQQPVQQAAQNSPLAKNETNSENYQPSDQSQQHKQLRQPTAQQPQRQQSTMTTPRATTTNTYTMAALRASEQTAGQRRPNGILLGAGCSAQVALGASTKIQQKQLKFLAAAAKSATGVDCSGCSSQRRMAGARQRQQQAGKSPASACTHTGASAASAASAQMHQQLLPDAVASPLPAQSRISSKQQARPADGLIAAGAPHRPCVDSSSASIAIVIGSTRMCNDCHHEADDCQQEKLTAERARHSNHKVAEGALRPIVNADNIICSATYTNGTKNSINFGLGANQQLLGQRQHSHHSYVNNSHHNPQQQHYSNQQHTMAHYKFHNDCQSSVLTYEQVKRLDFVMNQTVPIHGRGNFPTLYVKLRELIRSVRHKLQKEHSIEVRDVRLNGGAASYVLAPENSHYNDLDLVFGTDLSDENRFDVIRDVVLECLQEFYPREQYFNGKTCENEPNYSSNELSGGIIDGEIGAARRDQERSIIVSGLNLNAQQDREASHTYDQQSERINDKTGHSDCDSIYSDSIGSTMAHDRRPSAEKSETDAGSVDLNLENEICDRESSPEQVSVEDNTKQQCQTQAEQFTRVAHNFQYQPYQAYQMPLNSCAIKEAYVHKMVKVNDDDRWSLISLGVQQPDVICCTQASCSLSSASQPCNLQNQHYNAKSCSESKQSCAAGQQASGAQVAPGKSNAQAHSCGCQHQHSRSVCAMNHHRCAHHGQHQKQFPNSIELKFVDRMRRKFEFSVDSFQIILDFLMKFYDYAPLSTMSSQGNFASPHPFSTMISTRPLINKRHCAGCCVNRSMLEYKLEGGPADPSGGNLVKANQQVLRNQASAYSGSSGSASDSSPGFYPLPIAAANSSSISSVASSSGCSSSSSVVSSSSSSMSSDEDHEDLDCDADSPSSSSASTSSLLSSTNLSSLSSESACSGAEVAAQANISSHLLKEQGQTTVCNKSAQRNQINKDDSKNASAGPTRDSASRKTSSAPANARVETSFKPASNVCAECYGQQANLVDNITTDLETSSKSSSCAVISENFYPTVIGRSEYGDFKEALYHLETKQIATRSPEEIRGGGLLKYCNLLVKQYRPTNSYQIRTLERYMCSRFFIDFNDLSSQQAKLESYLANHFSDDPVLKFDYLTILHMVVQRSTVCLMSHELRLTLSMIRDMALSIQNASKRQPTCCM